jgi:hypothetical protein
MIPSDLFDTSLNYYGYLVYGRDNRSTEIIKIVGPEEEAELELTEITAEQIAGVVVGIAICLVILIIILVIQMIINNRSKDERPINAERDEPYRKHQVDIITAGSLNEDDLKYSVFFFFFYMCYYYFVQM